MIRIKRTKEERIQDGMQLFASALLSVVQDLMFDESEDYNTNSETASLDTINQPLTNPFTLNCKSRE